MNLSDANRFLNSLDARFDILDKHPAEILPLLTPSERTQFEQACRAFAVAESDGILPSVEKKCLEIAALNPGGGNLDDLFEVAVDLVQEVV